MKKGVVYIVIIALVVAAGYFLYPKDHSNVKYEVLKIDETQCYPFWFSANLFFQKNSSLPLLPQELIINTEEDYKNLLVYRRDTCNTPLPAIDFTNSTVLGKYAAGSCAAYGFEYKVWRDDVTRTVKFTVFPKEHRFVSCSGPGKNSMNLISVPKIPSDYSIQFEPAAEPKEDYRTFSVDPDNPDGWIERDYEGNVTRKGEGWATSTGSVQIGGFDPCMTQEVYDLMITSGGHFQTPPKICSEE